MDNVSGVSELQAAINAMTRELSDQLPAIVMAGAEIVESEIRDRAPVDTGALVRSLDAKAGRRKDSASATVQIEQSGPDGTEHYAIFQEYGTSKMPAHPFFRPGVEAAKPQIEAMLNQKILDVVASYDR